MKREGGGKSWKDVVEWTGKDWCVCKGKERGKGRGTEEKE